MKGFCTNCGKAVEIAGIKSRRLPNGVEVYEGSCPDCSTKILKKRGK